MQIFANPCMGEKYKKCTSLVFEVVVVAVVKTVSCHISQACLGYRLL